jgi:hypothetical protein
MFRILCNLPKNVRILTVLSTRRQSSISIGPQRYPGPGCLMSYRLIDRGALNVVRSPTMAKHAERAHVSGLGTFGEGWPPMGRGVSSAMRRGAAVEERKPSGRFQQGASVWGAHPVRAPCQCPAMAHGRCRFHGGLSDAEECTRNPAFGHRLRTTETTQKRSKRKGRNTGRSCELAMVCWPACRQRMT